jgi:hypothetical protein
MQAELAGLKVEVTTTVDSYFESIQLDISTGVTEYSNGLGLYLSGEQILVTAIKMHTVKGAKFRHNALKFAFMSHDKLEMKSVKYYIESMASSLANYNSSKVGA